MQYRRPDNQEDGWIKLYRKSLLNGWIKNHNLWVFWTYCLLKAFHKEHKAVIGSQQITLQPGQFIFGREKAAKDTGLSPRSVRTCVQNLYTMGNLTIKTTNKYSIITIVNWELYQSKKEEATSKTTKDRPATDQQSTTYKNIKNGKNDKKKIYPFEDELEVNNTSELSDTHDNSYYESCLKILQSIPGYPFDEIRDLLFLQAKEKDYPNINIISLLKNWKAYLLDHPLHWRSKPRMLLRNQFELAKQSGNHIQKKHSINLESATTTGDGLQATQNQTGIENAFEQFWNLYPKKKAKSDAMKAFTKINLDEELLQTMLSKIKQAMTSEDWLKQKGQFIPYPATWLNKKRWEDEDNGTVKKCNSIAKGLSDYSKFRSESVPS